MQTQPFTHEYRQKLAQTVLDMSATDMAGNSIDYAGGIDWCAQAMQKAGAANKKVMIVGNGGSAGIASHLAVDIWKNGKVRCTAFNDSSLLTCISNDIGYHEVFSKPIEAFADQGDMLMAISSSGSSVNILNAVHAARAKGCSVVTFSGMAEDNPLKALGDINFFVPSYSYGFVEILHTAIIHNILDAKMYCMDNIDIYNKNRPK
jgi:D-sedoheptulose 7-phosphate isomerase